MADDIQVTPGSGAAVATDDIGGKHYQKVKIGWGPDGTWTETSTAAAGRLPVADPVLVPATATDAGDEATTDEALAAAATGLRLVGFSARETTGTVGAVFNIRHGTSNAGTLLVTVSLGANESTREWYGPDGIAAASGVWLERVSGTTSVVGYTKVVA
jgi:hypothetical protein